MTKTPPLGGSFRAFGARHAAEAVPIPAAAPAPKARKTVDRPLRLSGATEAKLQALAAGLGVSLTVAIVRAILEEWDIAFRPTSTSIEQLVAAVTASARHPSDTREVPAAAARTSRTLRLAPEVDEKLGALAERLGGLDRTSTIAVAIAAAWRRHCA